jgi:effector-binding domain-containing protein
MKYEITLETAHPVTIAAVRSKVHAGGVSAAWKPALDKVWAFLRTNHVENTGQNVFLYHHPAAPGSPMTVDFGVQVQTRFPDVGDIACVETATGMVAKTVHRGPYDRLGDAHTAIHQWCRANGRPIAAFSWEIYGHWNSDSAKLETTIRYLLA